MIERRFIDLPPELAIDRLTAYIFKHYRQFLTADEQALDRLHIVRIKQFGARLRYPANASSERDRKLERLFQVNALAKNHPGLYRRLQSSTIAAEMAAARDRILRDFAGHIVLNECPQCGALCLTPRAKACLECGHTWHTQGAQR